MTKVNLVLDESLKPCYEKLSSMKPIPSATLCSSIIEMEAVEQVLDSRLVKISTDPRMNQVRADYRACVDSTKSDAVSGLPTDPTPLLDTRILGCSTNAIKKSAEVMAGIAYSESIENNKEMSDKKYALGLIKSVEALSVNCISKKLNELESWNSFKEYATGNDFKALQVTCTNQVTAFSISKILAHESSIKLNDLRKDGLLSNESPELIVSSSAEIMRKQVGLPPFEKGKDPIESLYLAKLAQNPNLTVEKFVGDFKKTVSSRAIESIHNGLMAEVRKQSDHPKLVDSLNAKCLGDIFTKFEKDLTSQSQPDKAVSSPLDPLARLLADGFSYSKSISPKAYDQSFSNMKTMCTEINKYKTLGDFLGEPKLAFLFEARIQKELISSFTKVANENYSSAVASLKGSADEAKLLPFAVKQKQEMLKLISDKLQNSNNFQIWMNSTNLKKEINSRISGLIGGDETIQAKLSEKVITSLFTNKSDYGFASEFTRIQLTSNLGMKGLAEARKTVKESVKDLKGFESGASSKIYVESLKSLNKHWTPKEIAADLDWHNLKASEREKLVNDLYQNAVVPETSVIRKPANMDVIEKSFTHVLETAKTSGNKTFNEKLEDKISADVKKEVGFWDALGGWLRPITIMPIMPIMPMLPM
jgi:hypothetical protein